MVKKTIVFLIFALLVVSVSAYSQTAKQKVQMYTIIGTIKTADQQGNNYLELTLLPSEGKKDIGIWCSGDKTKVYTSEKKATWNELTEGRKIKVSGKWIDHEGEKLLWADRIDLI
jgi:hypothetical protein